MYSYNGRMAELHCSCSLFSDAQSQHHFTYCSVDSQTYTERAKKWGHGLMSIILSNLNWKIFW